ncbi:MAG: hypothetical protein IJ656_03290 [Bacilli bacterium]|nr:hypothetical protein [Bacilli bacterium]MBR1582037.1 hypothetical protein [Bacilli bacterium]
MKFKLKPLLFSLLGVVSLGVSCGGPGGNGGSSIAGKNKDNSFAMVTSWTSSGLVNHYDSNTSCEAFNYFVVEGLYRYVRSTDEIFCQLAAEMPTHFEAPMSDYIDVMGQDAYDYYISEGKNKVTVSRVKIRPEAKWQNGEDFIAKDVWSYYYMIHPTSSNYMAAVKAVDDKTVEFVWNPLKEPVNAVKELLLAQDKCGTIKYDVFNSYIDPFYEIVMASPINTNQNQWGAFNRWSTDQQIVKMNVIKNNFFQYSPSWYIATGPFKLDTFSATQILLTKNEYYWNAKNIGFEKIKLYSSNDLNQTYSLITNGYVTYYDGFIQQDTLEGMLASNEDLLNLKMYDPGSIGLTFNLEKPIFTEKVREAFQYIFDRDEIRLSANPYATTSYYPLIGMAASEAERYMSKEHFEELPKYENNTAKAESLLNEAGWSKRDGRWYIGDNEVSLTLGAPSSHDISSTAAEATAAQLEKFGIKTKVLKSTAFYGNAESEHSVYDLTLEWTDLNMSFSYPTGSYNQFANIYSKWCHVPRYAGNYVDPQKAGQVKLIFNGLDGDTKTYEFADYINSFYSVSEEQLKYLVDVFNLGLSKMNLGIQFFQNVTASTYNASHITGIPLEQYWKENRNVSYVPPVMSEDFFIVARTNLPFATNYNIAYGVYQPNKAQ